MGLKEQAEMLLLMKADTDDMALGIARIITDFANMRAETERGQKGLTSFGVAWGNILAKLGYNILQAPIRAFGELTKKVKEFIGFARGATMDAARIEVQWRTLALTAGNAGQKIDDMAQHVNTLRAYGIRTGEALESVSQFLATGLPVENISELARRAQDMAVVIGSDSTDAFKRFSTFLQTGNSEWIRTMGITKTANQMLKEYADTQGLVVKALDDRQKKEALIQGLMKATMGYEGAYEEALEDPYKRWTSLPRLISNATEVLGHMFVPMLGTAVDTASDLLEKFESIFRTTKKGAYSKIAEDLGKSVEDLTGQEKAMGIEKYFGQWTDFAYDMRATVELAAEGINEVFQNLIGEAWGWGEGLGTNLTQGLLNAAQNVILPALVQITGWIADFLMPGSPPKKGPLSTIDQWGIGLMRTFMGGWTKIDFATFSQVASSIQSALTAAFTAAGRTATKEGKLSLKEALLSGRQLAARIVSEMGGGMQNIASLLSGVGGPLQADLLKYIELVQKYKGAIQGVTEAKNRLARAEAWVEEASNKVKVAREKAAEVEDWVAEASKKVSDLRDALRKKELQWAEIPERFVRGRKRQLQLEIMAAEEEEKRRQEVLDAAKEQIEVAQEEESSRREALAAMKEQVAAAQEHANTIQEEMSLQQARLQELAKQMEMEAEIAAAKAAAAKDEETAIEKIKNAWEGVFDPEKLEEAKERMRTLLEPLMPQVREIGDNFRQIWDGIKQIPGKVAEWWEKLKGIKAWFDDLPDWVKTILKGGVILAAINFATGGLISSLLTALAPLGAALGPTGLALTILATLIITNKEELLKWFDPRKAVEESYAAQTGIVGLQKMAEWSPINWLTGGDWGKWWNENVVYPLTESVLSSEDEIQSSVGEGVTGPIEEKFSNLQRNLVGESIVPDMVASITDWFTTLSGDTTAIYEETMQKWMDKTDLFSQRLEYLIGKINLLATGIRGLPTLPEELAMFAEGRLQINNVYLQGSTFGSNLTRDEVDDWMHEAIGGVMA